jgi:hypothetical protein
MNQAIAVFSNSAARSAAITSPLEGQVTYLEDTAAYESFDGSSWIGFGGGGKILQVVSTAKTDAFTMSSNTFTDVTGLSASITPTSATSKILVQVSLHVTGNPTASAARARLMRDSTAIALGDADGSKARTTIGNQVSADSGDSRLGAMTFLDSPATTSPTTYKVQVSSNVNSQFIFVNRVASATDSDAFTRSLSTLTLMEVAV